MSGVNGSSISRSRLFQFLSFHSQDTITPRTAHIYTTHICYYARSFPGILLQKRLKSSNIHSHSITYVYYSWSSFFLIMNGYYNGNGLHCRYFYDDLYCANCCCKIELRSFHCVSIRATRSSASFCI